jgi:predicted nuclease with TOPRIM domain
LGASSKTPRDIILTSALQMELENIALNDTRAMNKEQLWNYIQEIIRGLLALSQLPTTSRLNELLKEKQSVKDAEARISELQKEKENLKEILARIQQEQVATEQRIPEYNYGD